MTFDDLQRPYAWSTKVTGAPYLLNWVYFRILAWLILLLSRSRAYLKECYILDICPQIKIIIGPEIEIVRLPFIPACIYF